MIRPIITLWGLYKAYPQILDNIDLPEDMDRETMKDYIFMYAGDNESRYGDPDLLERLVTRWFSAKKHDFEMMYRALTIDYNPIENTDRYEDFWENTDRTENGSESRTEDNSVTRNSTSNSAQEYTTDGNTEGTGSNTSSVTRTPELTTEQETSAFDSETYQPQNKRTDTGTEKTEQTESSTSSATTSQNGNQTSTQSGNETETGKNSIDGKTENNVRNEVKHGLHSHGNIGVTTNQEMINQELELRTYDIYKQIALLFENEFTIPVYERRCNQYGIL